MEVERLKLRKCPEFPTFSAFLARLPLGDGTERKDPGFQLRWVGVDGGGEVLHCCALFLSYLGCDHRYSNINTEIIQLGY